MIEINELVIRIPGIGQEEGRMLGNEVAERLSQLLPQGSFNSNIDEIKLSFAGNTGATRGQLADNIAEQIMTQLNNR